MPPCSVDCALPGKKCKKIISSVPEPVATVFPLFLCPKKHTHKDPKPNQQVRHPMRHLEHPKVHKAISKLGLRIKTLKLMFCAQIDQAILAAAVLTPSGLYTVTKDGPGRRITGQNFGKSIQRLRAASSCVVRIHTHMCTIPPHQQIVDMLASSLFHTPFIFSVHGTHGQKHSAMQDLFFYHRQGFCTCFFLNSSQHQKPQKKFPFACV